MIGYVMSFTLLFIVCFENAIHKASHHKWSGKLYDWHRIHHSDYPAIALTSDKYIDSATRYDNLFVRYGVISLGVFYCVSSSQVFMIIATEIVAYAFLIEYFHEQFHLNHSWLNQYEWFRILKHNHHQHHRRQDKNFSFLTTIVDDIQGTREI